MKQKKKKNQPSNFSRISREAWGIILLFSGAFMVLSLLSYHHADPSVFNQTKQIPSNYGGRIGANIAEILIQFAGLGAFIFSALSFSFSIKLFQGMRAIKYFSHLVFQVLAVLCFATFLTLQTGPIQWGGATIPTGGLVGSLLADQLLHYLNLWGASLFTLSVLLICLVLSTPLSIKSLWKCSNLLVKTFSQALYQYGVLRLSQTAKIIGKKTLHFVVEKKQQNTILKSSNALLLQLEPSHPSKIDPNLSQETVSNFKEIESNSFTETVSMPSSQSTKKNLLNVLKSHISARQGDFTLPPLSFLLEPSNNDINVDRDKLIKNSKTPKTYLLAFYSKFESLQGKLKRHFKISPLSPEKPIHFIVSTSNDHSPTDSSFILKVVHKKFKGLKGKSLTY